MGDLEFWVWGERGSSGEREEERADGESESESEREYSLNIVGPKTVDPEPTGQTGRPDRLDRSSPG